MPKYIVTIHKQTTQRMDVGDIKDSDSAITAANAGDGKVIDQLTVSVQYVPQEVVE